MLSVSALPHLRAMTVWITHDMGYVKQASVGFSGVIFTLALMESYRSTQPTRQVFGMIQVPTRMYPWVLLVMLSVRFPSGGGEVECCGSMSALRVGNKEELEMTRRSWRWIDPSIVFPRLQETGCFLVVLVLCFMQQYCITRSEC